MLERNGRRDDAEVREQRRRLGRRGGGGGGRKDKTSPPVAVGAASYASVIFPQDGIYSFSDINVSFHITEKKKRI